MATFLGRPPLPRCSRCVRQLLSYGTEESRPFQQQVRGKRKMPNLKETITVRLLTDVKRFGPKGSLVPVPVGKMRNLWFPRRTAEYVMVPQLRELRTNNVTVERDVLFDPTPITAKAESTSGVIETPDFLRSKGSSAVLSPQRATELLSILLPPRLDFFRKPIESEPAPLATDHPAAPIYGSVSTADVVSMVRDVLGANDEAANVVLSEEDVRFTGSQAEEESGRIKHLGEFKVEMRVKDGPESVWRRLWVRDPRREQI